MPRDASVSPLKLDGFLKIDDIPGSSERDTHDEEIEVFGVWFKLDSVYDEYTHGRRGRVSASQFKVWKYYDKASPLLKSAIFTNKELGDVTFSATRTIGTETKDYLVVKLTDTFAISYEMKQSADAPDLIEEEVGFAYKTIAFTYDEGDEMLLEVSVGT